MKEPFIVLRVLLERDTRYDMFVAYCLQTGNVITADDAETAESMIKELLEDEVSYAIVHNSLKNLLSSPAPMDIWKRWIAAAATQEPKKITLNITARELRLDEPESFSEVKVARSAAAGANA